MTMNRKTRIWLGWIILIILSVSVAILFAIKSFILGAIMIIIATFLVALIWGPIDYWGLLNIFRKQKVQ